MRPKSGWRPTQSAEIDDRNRQQAARSDENRADRSPNVYTAQTKPKITAFLRVSSYWEGLYFGADPADAGQPAKIDHISLDLGGSSEEMSVTSDPLWEAGGSRTYDAVVGTGGNDKIDGSSGNDIIIGSGGDDVVNGGAGNDVLITGDWADGNDFLYGGAGNDTLYTGYAGDGSGVNGNDVLEGGTGSNTYVLVDDGNQDLLLVGAGDSMILGANEDDRLAIRLSDPAFDLESYGFDVPDDLAIPLLGGFGSDGTSYSTPFQLDEVQTVERGDTFPGDDRQSEWDVVGTAGDWPEQPHLTGPI